MFKILNKFLKNVLLFFITFYKKFISPLLPSACIYKPTCSEYSKEALFKFGIIKGLILSFLRVLRCNPLFKGGEDVLSENLTLKEAIKKYKDFFIFLKK
ncbi:MAG: membrane protein insertion efficiency factor YidD [Brevinematales bacterium]|nr:membrane protein insertion efficiency factor YidD [Brevinematales bacterium]